ncbi:MAG: DUF6089 family protein [Ferruginibacter sp.]
MKPYLFVFLFLFSTNTHAQQWFAELTAGTSSYNGDLTQKEFSITRIGPMVGFNLKYNTGDFVNIRAGISYAKFGANDLDNPDPGLQSRRLNFKTNVIELNVCAEVNVFDPETYYSYPYIFGGVGLFHFNPYTYTDNGQKAFLQPLGTEGQGLASYPDRKKYSLYQVCFPVGGGFKLNLKQDWEISFELGYRILVTDYLDDVSKTYVNLKALQESNGTIAGDLSYRKQQPFLEEGEKRGNSGVRDSYFFTGIKIATVIGKRKNAGWGD